MKRLLIMLSLFLLAQPVGAKTFSPEITRITGDNRYDTAVGVSQLSFGSARTVLIASGQSFPDALAGSALASSLDAPILLTAKDSLSADTVTEIARLEPRQIIILGSEGSVSAKVGDQLSSLAKVRRIGGKDRYETAALISKEVLSINGKTEVGLTSGENFPDALAASSYLKVKGIPLLLTNPKSMSGPSQDFISSKPVEKISIFGGENTVASSLLGEGVQASRIAGSNRYDTAVKIGEKAFAKPANVILVNGENFPDALSATGLMTKYHAPIILVAKDTIPQPVKDYLLKVNPEKIFIVGGSQSVSAAVVSELWQMTEDQEKVEPDLKPGTYNEAYAKDLMDLLNGERKAQKVKVLKIDKDLVQAAKTRAKELAQDFSSTSRPDGQAWSTVSPKAKGQLIVALNVFPGDVFNQMKAVPTAMSDREDFQAMGAGVWTDEKGNTYWVVLFGLTD